jgi:hypothetical protein
MAVGKYYQNKLKMQKKNNGQAIELQLFHGTRSNDPYLIYNGEVGFDMRFSSTGMWGIGIYFAQNASYSDGYAYNSTARSFSLPMSWLAMRLSSLLTAISVCLPKSHKKVLIWDLQSDAMIR